MPSVGHVAVGLAASRLTPDGMPRARWAALLVLLSCLPDADVVAFALGIPYAAPFGHRGASHSLAFAVACGGLLVLAATTTHTNPTARRMGLIGGVVVATHGLLDTLTDGGLGVALLWPFSDTRFFAPWRPIPVAPIGARLFSSRGWDVILHECVLFLPLLVAGVLPRRRRA